MKTLARPTLFLRLHVTTNMKPRITRRVSSKRRLHPLHRLRGEPNGPLTHLVRPISDVCYDHDTYCMTFREITRSQTGVIICKGELN